jgi:hypothetical protein
MGAAEYFSSIQKLYAGGRATERSYRGYLARLIETLEPIDCGAPDYIITQRGLPVGYIEAKNLDQKTDLDAAEKSAQLERYLKSLNNLALTNYLEFRFYKNGSKVAAVSIGKLNGGKLAPAPENWAHFADLLRDFCAYTGQTITAPEKLAKMMAGKARLMQEIIFNTVNSAGDNSLKEQLLAFRKILIHDMDAKQFSDIYAQTITYGLFAARLHDRTLENFSRQEARELAPRSNPFLRQFFDYISGANLDDNVAWIVDDLANIFLRCDVRTILQNFGAATKQTDQLVHFYEAF